MANGPATLPDKVLAINQEYIKLSHSFLEERDR